MHKGLKSTGGGAVIYKPVGVTTEVKSGYLLKSPPIKQFRSEKSWKRRYFVLYKVGEHGYELKYSKSLEEKDKVHGEIDLLHISQMCVSPEQNQRWGWIQKTFKCSSACVLLIRVDDRDFFLIGEDSSQIDEWFSVLFEALKTRPHSIATAECLSRLQSVMVISKPIKQKRTCAKNEPEPKGRSLSDPTSNAMENDLVKTKREETTMRRFSESVNFDYDYPRAYLRSTQKTAVHAAATRRFSLEEIYEPMKRLDEQDGKRPLSNFSSGSSNNGTASQEEMLEGPCVLHQESSTESLEDVNPEEKDIMLKQAVMKKHLTITAVDGRPTVSGWTGQPQSQCLFHKGDQVLAINDLHTGSVDEFNMYLSRTLKNEVKVTILRQHGFPPLHLPNCMCSG